MNTSSETIAQLHAENQRLRARIAAQEADTTRTPAIISDITFAPPIWLNVVSDAIFVTDARHQIVFWNRAAEQIYGWSHAEVVGRPITEVIRVVRYVSGESIASVLNTLMTTGSWRGEVIHHTRNGHEVIVDSLVHQIADNQGTIAHYLPFAYFQNRFVKLPH